MRPIVGTTIYDWVDQWLRRSWLGFDHYSSDSALVYEGILVLHDLFYLYAEFLNWIKMGFCLLCVVLK